MNAFFPSVPLCFILKIWKEKRKKVIIKLLSASFCLLLFSQQGNASKGRWVAARWQTRCCVYYRETGRAFDWESWIISGISESVIFPFFLWNWVMKRSPEYFLVSIHSWLCLVPVILIWAETSFYFVAVLHWIPLVLKLEEGDAHLGLWKCLFVVLLVAQTKVPLAHSDAKSVGLLGADFVWKERAVLLHTSPRATQKVGALGVGWCGLTSRQLLMGTGSALAASITPPARLCASLGQHLGWLPHLSLPNFPVWGADCPSVLTGNFSSHRTRRSGLKLCQGRFRLESERAVRH